MTRLIILHIVWHVICHASFAGVGLVTTGKCVSHSITQRQCQQTSRRKIWCYCQRDKVTADMNLVNIVYSKVGDSVTAVHKTRSSMLMPRFKDILSIRILLLHFIFWECNLEIILFSPFTDFSTVSCLMEWLCRKMKHDQGLALHLSISQQLNLSTIRI